MQKYSQKLILSVINNFNFTILDETRKRKKYERTEIELSYPYFI